MSLNLNISIPGGKGQVPITGISRKEVLEYIKKLRLDSITQDLIIKDMNSCPDSALIHFRDNIGDKLRLIRSKI